LKKLFSSFLVFILSLTALSFCYLSETNASSAPRNTTSVLINTTSYNPPNNNVQKYTAVSTGTYNGHTYSIYNVSMTWKEAKKYCESIGGHLVTITSAQEQKFIEPLIYKALYNGQKFIGKGQYYIGATDEVKEGAWKWITGESFSYTNWYNTALPKSYPENDYAVIYNSYGWGTTKDKNVTGNSYDYTNTGFICEWDKSSGSTIPNTTNNKLNTTNNKLNTTTGPNTTNNKLDTTTGPNTTSKSNTTQKSGTTSTGNSSSISQSEVYNRMIALKSKYPDGTPWTNANRYNWKGGIYGYGDGCAGFAFMLSDAAFGDLPARQIYNFNNIRVGDILRINNDTHSVIVLGIEGTNITIAEGNYNSAVKWGRVITLDEIKKTGVYMMTRYPSGS